MGQPPISGLADKTTARLLKIWPIRSGQLFDGAYPEEFLEKTIRPRIAEPGNAPPGVQEPLGRDKENATVDVSLAFR
jgi:hypothetical protein